MKNTVLIKYLLDSGFLCVDESDIETLFTKDIEEAEKKLETILTKEQIKEVNHLKYDLVSHMFNIRDKECFKMLYLGIVLGMEVEKFVHEEYEEL